MCCTENCLPEALSAFPFGGEIADVRCYGAGHINDTFCVLTEIGTRFILQRMSAVAFPHPGQVMENIIAVTEFLAREVDHRGGDKNREVLQVLRPKHGGNCYSDREGRVWRAFPFIEGTRCFQTAGTPALFAASGRAFGEFQKLLRAYPAHTLYETIPHFHDTAVRLEQLKAALRADPLGRVESCHREVDFILAREADCSVALDALTRGDLPLRVTHNDTKINNVLLDAERDEAVCIIDLDTVMPGLSINDFGDSIRFGANHCAEDERAWEKMSLDMTLYAAYTEAFLQGAGGTLTAGETAYLPWGARLMTLECGMRFLTDYLSGDTYFRTTREGQNLDRCRTQLQLVADMETRWDEMRWITEDRGKSVFVRMGGK